MRSIGHYLGGRDVPGRSGKSGPVFDPATGEQQATVDFASGAEVDDAVKVAAEAAKSWRDSSLGKRADVLFRFRQILADRRLDLARIVSSEHGKVPADAAGEVARGIENVEFAAGIPQLLKGEYSEGVSTGVDVYSLRQPLGVVAAITPFNFPAMVPLWMISNAIACGNTVILKPSEKAPSAPLTLAKWLEEAGLPSGVLNVVNGDKVAVDRLLEHPGIAAVSFVGSTPVARSIYQRGTTAGKRVQALGGAKNHMVVLPDADLAAAADAAVGAAYGSAGERCMAISVVVAVGPIAEALVEAIAARLPKVSIGPGTDPAAEMGPLITREHRDKVASYLDLASKEGAKVVVDGRARRFAGKGFFLGVSLIYRVTRDMVVYRDEIFGPVLSIVRAASYPEALDIVNTNPYGNGAAIFTRDGGAARQFQREVTCGMVGVNVSIPVPVAYYSFGGWKDSLFGDTHMYGPDGVRFYTRGKVITSRWPDPATSKIDLGFPQTR